VNYAEYYQKETPKVQKAPRIPDFLGWVPSLDCFSCEGRKVWLNGKLSRFFMWSVKVWRKVAK